MSIDFVVYQSYISVQESIKRNAYRHEARGLNWIELGYDDKARGSFAKAVKFHNKADRFDVPEVFSKIVNQMAKNVAEAIMSGTFKL
jgi:hypothetical protein